MFHFRKLNSPRCIIELDLGYNSNTLLLFASPVTRSSTYREFFKRSVNSILNSSDSCASKWCRIVDPEMAGDGLSPITSLLNLNGLISEFRSPGSHHVLVGFTNSYHQKGLLDIGCQTNVVPAKFNKSVKQLWCIIRTSLKTVVQGVIASRWLS